MYNHTKPFFRSAFYSGRGPIIEEETVMKKVSALLLALCLLVALTACGGSSSAPAATAAPAAPAATDAPAAAPAEAPADSFGPKDGGTSLTFTTGGPAGTYYAFGGVIAQKVSEVTSTSVTAIPITPAAKPTISVSALNTLATSFLDAPMARRIPISLVRSSTLM